MADNEIQQRSVELSSDSARLARERLIWAIKPFGFLGLLLWVLSPSTSDVDPDTLATRSLLAFLLGSGYGLLLFWRHLKQYLLFQMDLGRDQKNRLPDEFYVGTVDEVLVEWNKN